MCCNLRCGQLYDGFATCWVPHNVGFLSVGYIQDVFVRGDCVDKGRGGEPGVWKRSNSRLDLGVYNGLFIF